MCRSCTELAYASESYAKASAFSPDHRYIRTLAQKVEDLTQKVHKIHRTDVVGQTASDIQFSGRKARNTDTIQRSRSIPISELIEKGLL